MFTLLFSHPAQIICNFMILWHNLTIYIHLHVDKQRNCPNAWKVRAEGVPKPSRKDVPMDTTTEETFGEAEDGRGRLVWLLEIIYRCILLQRCSASLLNVEAKKEVKRYSNGIEESLGPEMIPSRIGPASPTASLRRKWSSKMVYEFSLRTGRWQISSEVRVKCSCGQFKNYHQTAGVDMKFWPWQLLDHIDEQCTTWSL